MTTITLEDGKYTIESEGGRCVALRHGEPWRDLTGDKLICALVSRIEQITHPAPAKQPLDSERAALIKQLRDGQKYDFSTGDFQDMSSVMDDAADMLEADARDIDAHHGIGVKT